MANNVLSFRVPPDVFKKLEELRTQYKLRKISDTVLYAIDTLYENKPHDFTKSDLAANTAELQALRKEIERLEFIIMQGAKK